MTPAEFIRTKTPIPSEMLTRDWDRVQAAARERAFFMAGVTRGEILDAFQEAVEAEAAGKVNHARSQEMVRERLAAMGYAPAPGTAGSIKDLSSWRRLSVTIATNKALAAGWAGYQKQIKAAAVFPAKQMIRQTLRREPRAWPAIWRRAAATLSPDGINVAEMAAHITHPIWRAISRFGLPYPIYDFGSGMGDKIIRKDAAAAMGVAQAPAPETPVSVPADVPGADLLAPTMNDGLEASPDIRTRAVRDQVAADLRGSATWAQDDAGRQVLVYRDPNGTRPAAAADLPEVISRSPVPDGPLYQREAAALYASEGPRAFAPGSDALYDMARLVHRCEPMDDPPPLWAAREFPDDAAAEAWVSTLATGMEPAPGWPWLVCDPSLDRILPALPAKGRRAVVITIRKATAARDLRPVIRGFTAGEDIMPGIFIESGRRYRLIRSQSQANVTQYVVEEVPES